MSLQVLLPGECTPAYVTLKWFVTNLFRISGRQLTVFDCTMTSGILYIELFHCSSMPSIADVLSRSCTRVMGLSCAFALLHFTPPRQFFPPALINLDTQTSPSNAP